MLWFCPEVTAKKGESSVFLGEQCLEVKLQGAVSCRGDNEGYEARVAQQQPQALHLALEIFHAAGIMSRFCAWAEELGDFFPFGHGPYRLHLQRIDGQVFRI